MPPTRKAAAAARRSMSRTKEDEKPKGLAARRSRPAGAKPTMVDMFIISKFKLEDNATTDGRIATAIRRGNESGVFALPKGFGGKIRIAEDTATSSSSTARKPPAKRTTANSTGTARQKQSEGGKRGAAKTNAKRGATTSTRTSSRKTTSSSSRRARN
ncbi:hypothetical protein OF846_000174 [Rhodotorula toruloides]|nr:hypothetical protein OF846_000174 [Rhodotorula toruloides]